MFCSYSILHALNTCAGRRVGRTSFWRHCGTARTATGPCADGCGRDDEAVAPQNRSRLPGGPHRSARQADVGRGRLRALPVGVLDRRRTEVGCRDGRSGRRAGAGLPPRGADVGRGQLRARTPTSFRSARRTAAPRGGRTSYLVDSGRLVSCVVFDGTPIKI